MEVAIGSTVNWKALINDFMNSITSSHYRGRLQAFSQIWPPMSRVCRLFEILRSHHGLTQLVSF